MVRPVGTGAVVIVGGTSGIGLRLAERYAAHERDVVITGRDADRDRAARARSELDPVTVEIEDGLAGEDVEARLERVQVRVDVAAVDELDEHEAGVRRARVRADQDRARQSVRTIWQRRSELDVLATNERVHASFAY